MNNKVITESLLQKFKEFDWQPRDNSNIADFYKNKNIFLTGATGFVGKLILEKLLRACFQLNTIFILVRSKKGENVDKRIENLFSEEVFIQLSKVFPKFQQKIRIINGDASLPDLGLSQSDKNTIIEQVDVIFHLAATVRFDEKITTSLAINVRGTRDLLNLAKQCKHLECFVYVSTAYANCIQKKIDEVFYPTSISSEEVITMLETKSEEELSRITLKERKRWPNVYVFTKAIAEEVIYKHSESIPTCIVRPSIVAPTYKEPMRSWIDNYYGVSGIVLGSALGLLRTMQGDKKKAAEIVPADYVVNNIIASAYKTALDKPDQVCFYNYVSSVEDRLTWENLIKLTSYYGINIPPIKCVWYYNFTFNKYYFVHIIYCIFLHVLPGLFMDSILIAIKQKPIITKLYRKMHKLESVLIYFTINEWTFYNNNTQALWNSLSNEDKKMFPFSIKELVWEDYFSTLITGLRVYLLKDDLSTLPQAKKKWIWLYIADRTLKIIFSALCLRFVWQFLSKLIS